jgi:hypothetical protein
MKMRRRILHWSSQGFIHILGKVNQEELQQGFSFYKRSPTKANLPKGRDSALGKLLIGMHEKGEIDSVIMSKCGRPELFSERLTNLVAAFKEPPLPLAEEQTDGLDVYNWGTCSEFHKLLLATLLAYGRALDELGKLDTAIRPNRRQKKTELNQTELDELGKNRDECAEQVRLCGIVLWRIAYSRVLCHHLEVLGMGGVLDQPSATKERVERYRLYTAFSSINCPDVHWREDDSARERDNGAQEEDEFSFARGNEYSSTGFDMVEMYQKWIRQHATHWTALFVLSTNARLTPDSESLKIHLIAMRHPNPNNDLQTEPWRDTIRDVLAHGPHQSTYTQILNEEAVIDTITRHITREKGAGKWVNPIFYAFQGGPERVKCASTTHCEATLAALWKYPTAKLHSDDVTTLIKVTVIHPHRSLI